MSQVQNLPLNITTSPILIPSIQIPSPLQNKHHQGTLGAVEGIHLEDQERNSQTIHIPDTLALSKEVRDRKSTVLAMKL